MVLKVSVGAKSMEITIQFLSENLLVEIIAKASSDFFMCLFGSAFDGHY